MTAKALAEAISARRAELGMTQTDLSAASNRSLQTVQQLEVGKRTNYQALTLAHVDYGLKWQSGTAAQLMKRPSEQTSTPASSDRPAEDVILLDVAEVLALRGTCSRLKVGAVLTRDGRILSTGRNGAPTGLEHCTHTRDEPCTVSVHAEANAIAFAARTGGGAEGSTLYLTHAPCLGCSGLVINSGVARVVYRWPYRIFDGVDRLTAAGVDVTHLPEETRCVPS